MSWVLDSVLNFIRSHPLMDEAVAHKDNEPVFYMRDLFFTRLVVDVLDYVVFGNHMHYTVYYAATSEYNNYHVIMCTGVSAGVYTGAA